ncbi:MAG: DNA-directed RNA polymerase subunit RpoH/Rpb5 C-terminal domain-containing protein [Candidatus Micrarchaeota archaeon]
MVSKGSSKKVSRKKKDVAEESVDVLGYELVPKMEILSESEKKKVLVKFGINDKQLPKLRSSDPEAKALKANVGDLIKVLRNDSTGEYVAYRLVID